MFEIIYTQFQTNGGGVGGEGIHKYLRGIWSNNHNSHNWNILDQLGGGGTVALTISAGQDSTVASGKLTITEVVGTGSYGGSKLIVKALYSWHSYSHTPA